MAPVGDAAPCSTGAAKDLGSPATGWVEWTGTECGASMVTGICEGLGTPGRLVPSLPKLGVAGSNPVRRSL